MLKVKDRKIEKSALGNSQAKINKKSIFRKIAISSVLLLSAITSWDVAVTASNINHAKTLVDYKYNYYNSLENYSTLKDKINAVPYTDADFKRDLNLFSNIYGDDKNSEGFRKYLNTNKSAINMNYILLMNNNYNNTDKMIDEVNQYLKGVSLDKIGDWKNNYDLNKGVSNIQSKYMKKSSREMLLKSYGFLKMERSEYAELDNKVYDNFSNLLISEGFNPNSFFLSKENLNFRNNIWKGNKTKAEQEVMYKELNDKLIKNNELALKYYKDGDLAKLRELFRLGNGFFNVTVEQPALKTADAQFGIPLSSLALYSLGIGYDSSANKYLYDFASQAGIYAKYTGQMKPGQESYYNDTFSMLSK